VYVLAPDSSHIATRHHGETAGVVVVVVVVEVGAGGKVEPVSALPPATVVVVLALVTFAVFCVSAALSTS
jgi:hypothetical protein